MYMCFHGYAHVHVHVFSLPLFVSLPLLVFKGYASHVGEPVIQSGAALANTNHVTPLDKSFSHHWLR